MNPSASELDRVFKCPPSAVLKPRVEESGEAAERGNNLHEFLRRVAVDPSQRDSALECIEDLAWRKTASLIDLNVALDGLTVVATETAYAVNVKTGGVTYLGSNIERKYNDACQKLYGRDLDEYEFTTTLDVEARDIATGRPVIIDWKSGKRQTPVAENNQMLLQGYVALKKFEADEVELRLDYIQVDGNVEVDAAVLGSMDLDDYPGKLLALKAKIEAVASQETPTLVVGDHCTYCKHIRFCSAHNAMIRSVLTGIESFNPDASMMTLEDVGNYWNMLKKLYSAAEKVEESLKLKIYKEGSVPADPGYEWRVVESKRSGLDGDAVRGLLTVLDATPEQKNSIVKVSKFQTIKRCKVKEHE